FDADAAAHVRVDLDVDHGRARAGGRVHQVDALGIHGGGAAGVRDAVAAGAGVDRTGAAGGVQHVVAAAAGHHVAAAAAVDGVAAGTAFEEVAAAAAVDAVVAVAAMDDVNPAAALDHVVAAAAEDVVAAAAVQGDDVVADARVDPVVAAAGDFERVLALAGLGDDVHADVGRHLDHVVAGAGADGQLLRLRHRQRVGLAVDGHVQSAVVALADADSVGAAPGGEHQLVGADIGLAGAGVGQGRLACNRHVRAAMQGIDLDLLAVRGLVEAALGRIAGGAVDFGHAQARQQREQRRDLDRFRVDRIAVKVGGRLQPALLCRRILPVAVAAGRGGIGETAGIGGLDRHLGVSRGSRWDMYTWAYGTP